MCQTRYFIVFGKYYGQSSLLHDVHILLKLLLFSDYLINKAKQLQDKFGYEMMKWDTDLENYVYNL